MERARRSVLLLAADEFEDIELLYPLYRLREEEVAVTAAGLDDQPVTGRKGHGPVPVDSTAGQVAADDFDALVVPAGTHPTSCGARRPCLPWCELFDGAGKPIAFICHAGWVPISAKIVKGRRAASVAAIRDDMVNAGVNWADQAAVVDGNLISARTPADLGPWMKALLAALGKPGS
jgi:protease I